MTLNLHAGCKSRVMEALTRVLANIKVNNNMFVDTSSTIDLVSVDSILPQNGKLRDQFVDYIGDYPLAKFVLNSLGQELWELDQFSSDAPPVNLSEMEGYDDPSSVAARLLDSFDTLPWTYQLTFPLPNQLSGLLPPDVDEFLLTPAVRIARPTERFMHEFPLAEAENERQIPRYRGGLLAGLPSSKPRSWDAKILYLQVQTDGFVGRYGGTSTITEAERLVRAFCGLGIALHLFSHEHKFRQSEKKLVFEV